MDFLNFLITAKKNTYASSKMSDRLNKDGSKEFVFEKEDLKYVDRFLGYNPFSGSEIVFKNNKPIWTLNYYGLVDTILISEKEVYSFLKKALQKVEERFPLRGPNYYKEEDLEYFSNFSGNLENFIGSERIELKGETIYTCQFHGGIIKEKLI
jgi:hypothetical protein